VVFVADSQLERMEANQESMQNLYDNMAEYGYDITRMPFVVQYNKRDLPNAASIAELQSALNPGWEVSEAARQRTIPDPYHAGENLVEQIGSGEWVERANYFEGVAGLRRRGVRHPQGREQARAQVARVGRSASAER
jgi:hypothetical protein